MLPLFNNASTLGLKCPLARFELWPSECSHFPEMMSLKDEFWEQEEIVETQIRENMGVAEELKSFFIAKT